jgi:hypothetical protein
LHRHDVRFVLIGGFGAIYHGAAHVTFDVDITPERSRENLERLSAALDDVGARIRTDAVDGGLPFAHDGESLARSDTWNLETAHGDLDISFMPAGTDGYADLIESAEHTTVLGVEIDVASLADIVRSKEAAGRTKDLLALPTLRRLLDERYPNP